LIEDILEDTPIITNALVDLKKEVITFEVASNIDTTTLVTTLNNALQASGYTVSTEKLAKVKKDEGIIWQALPIGILFLALFILLQKSGVLNLGLSGSITPVTSFIIGIIASVSSCLAVVGGLVLSLSATVAQDTTDDTKPMFLFHAGRLISFALLGGLLGAIGGALGVNFTVGAVLGLIASTVMIILGLNLVGVFEKSNITLPSGLFAFFRRVEHQTIAPFLLGVGTFFLPCGFTQSMQLAALSSESFFSGLLIMLGFALGTLPVLSLLSFGSASFAKSKHAPLFFKSAGVVVIGLGSLSLLAGLAGLGIIPPLFTI
jgi:sulfite exporter TauE/SafE